MVSGAVRAMASAQGRPRDERLGQVLAQHVGQVLRGIAAYRVTAAFVPLLDPTRAGGSTAWAFVVPATALVVALNVALLVLAGRLALHRPGRARALALVDLSVAVAVNLAAALLLPVELDDPGAIPFWYVLQGTVAVLVAVRWAWAAAVLVPAGLALQVLMLLLSGVDLTDAVLGRAALGTLWLLLALVCAVMVVRILRLHAEVALGEGMEVGADREQVRTARSLHDTVLQTLEAIALRTAEDAVDPARRLREVHEAARSQADELRASLHRRRLGQRAVRSFPVRIGDAVDHALRAGVETDVVADVGVDLPAAAAEAAAGAVREALTNVAKHAGVRRASVRLHDRGTGVLVVVEDTGRGFDPALVARGFGISQSIVRRLADAGGRARVSSRPGRGTVVRLWVPREPGGTEPVGNEPPAGATASRRPVPPRTRVG